MTDKAYIVANKEQELNVLKKFEQNNFFWDEGEKPAEWVPSKTAFAPYNFNFPYVLASGDDGNIIWFMVDEITDEEIVYDGRNEEEKHKVTREFINELIKWRDDNSLETKTGYMYEAVDGDEIQRLPDVVDIWWTMPSNSIERNNRLIVIIRWLNGEDVFEVEEPHKFVVRSKHTDGAGDYPYIKVVNRMALVTDYIHAMKFDAREEAQEWANSHQVVVEIDAEGNEV